MFLLGMLTGFCIPTLANYLLTYFDITPPENENEPEDEYEDDFS